MPDTDATLRALAQRWLVHLQSGRMTEAELAELRSWLGADRTHRRVFEEERAVWRGLEGLQSRHLESPPAHRPERRDSPERPEHLANAARTRVLGMRWLAAAALAACVAFITVATGVPTRARADFYTRSGEIAQVRLEDGSIAELNTDSAFRLRFTAGERRVELLQGEVWFKVAHDKRRPFRVLADHSVAEAVGTAFGVREDRGAVTVSVTEGHVAVRPSQPGAGSRQIDLREGEQAVLSGNTTATVATYDASAIFGWRDHRLVLEDLPIADAVRELDRHRPGRIFLVDGSRAQVKVSGVFALEDLDEGLAGFAASQNLRLTFITPYVAVLY